MRSGELIWKRDWKILLKIKIVCDKCFNPIQGENREIRVHCFRSYLKNLNKMDVSRITLAKNLPKQWKWIFRMV